MSERIGVVVVGYGYWGPNIVRNVMERPELELIALCERDASRAERFAQRFPGIPTVADFDEVLRDPRVQAVSIATPPRTHYPLARQALEAGRHVLVEKPLATTVADAEELIELAEARGLVLMPGHTFLYSPAVTKIRDLIVSGELGEVYFATSSRMNLGLYQPDGVIRDLAPHDLSILLYWLDRPVTQVVASGRAIFQSTVPETAFLTLEFAGGTKANVQVSWLAPSKVRQTVLVGSNCMVIYDDTAADEAVRIYDRGLDVDLEAPLDFGAHRMTTRSGDIVVPRLDAVEPLAQELADFANSIRTGATPRSHSRLGLDVVRILEAAHESFAADGEPVALAAPDGTTPRTPRAIPLGLFDDPRTTIPRGPRFERS
jgi:predicted dehydrogenase